MADDQLPPATNLQGVAISGLLAGLGALVSACANKGAINVEDFEKILDALNASGNETGADLQMRLDIVKLLKNCAREGAPK